MDHSSITKKSYLILVRDIMQVRLSLPLKGGGSLSVYESLSLMFMFGMLLLAALGAKKK